MFRWYVINTYSGQEARVRTDMVRRAETLGAREYLKSVVIPTEKVYVGEGAERTQIEQPTMPGYLLVHLDLNENSWSVVRHTPGVTGFVGASSQPDPLSKSEVDRMLGREGRKSALTSAPVFAVGDQVEILEGPLKGFVGAISELDEVAAKAKILVSIFGRETPAESAFTNLKRHKG
jgi:transcription termination/antitermination protein NusG